MTVFLNVTVLCISYVKVHGTLLATICLVASIWETAVRTYGCPPYSTPSILHIAPPMDCHTKCAQVPNTNFQSAPQ